MLFNVKNITIAEGSVNRILDPTGVVIWRKKSEPIVTTATPMYFEGVDGGQFHISVSTYFQDAYTATLETSTDGVNWELWGSTSTTDLTKQVSSGRLYIRATEDVGYFNNTYIYYNGFKTLDNVNVGGNIMSLAYKNFEDKTTINQNSAFSAVFIDMKTLIDASNLILPATKITDECYFNLFRGCTSLTTAPKVLPATKLARHCYHGMFYNCSSLTEAPKELPATQLVEYCYSFMFSRCTSLATAPVLQARRLVNYCYENMFQECTNLNKIITYAEDISAHYCLIVWLDNVSPTGDFYNLGGATYPSGISGIPSGWTEHTSL